MSEQVARVESLKLRCSTLYDRMGYNPDRSHWEMEFLSILMQLADILSILDNHLSVTSVNLEDISNRVASLEVRYSELLYRISDRKG